MRERKSPTTGASTGGCGVNSTGLAAVSQPSHGFISMAEIIARARDEGRIELEHDFRSTTTEAQHQRILNALRTGPKNSHELRWCGCYQVATRILELRRMGYVISTTRVPVTDAGGYLHPHCALYTLVSEAERGQV